MRDGSKTMYVIGLIGLAVFVCFLAVIPFLDAWGFLVTLYVGPAGALFFLFFFGLLYAFKPNKKLFRIALGLIMLVMASAAILLAILASVDSFIL